MCKDLFKFVLSLAISSISLEKAAALGPILQDKWPTTNFQFGQISAVALDSHGNVFVFHRGRREWDSQSFSSNNIFEQRKEGPIIEDTVVVLDPFNGSVIFKWGGGRFYLPHGLTIDNDDNVWITDVALHQVFKFPPLNKSTAKKGLLKASLRLGTAFQPGHKDNYFCKPTDVAVLSNGDFFVSDGYCNSKIIKYNSHGQKLLEVGKTMVANQAIDKYSLNVPHSLALAEEKQILFVADRENGRIVAYNSSSGYYITSIYSNDLLGDKVYAVSYTPVHGGLLYAVNGPSYRTVIPLQSVVFNVTNVANADPVFVFYPPNYFHSPHDVVVSSNGQVTYVVELQPHKVWQFHFDDEEPSPIVSQVNVTNVTKTTTTTVSNLVNTKHYNKQQDGTLLTGTLTAYILVSIVVLGAFLLVCLMLRAKSGRFRGYEAKGLIQDYDDEDGT